MAVVAWSDINPLFKMPISFVLIIVSPRAAALASDPFGSWNHGGSNRWLFVSLSPDAHFSDAEERIAVISHH